MIFINWFIIQKLDQTDDPEDRKVIRDRIKELRSQKAVKKGNDKTEPNRNLIELYFFS